MSEHSVADFLCQGAFLRIALGSACFFGVYGALMTRAVQRRRDEAAPWPGGRRPWSEMLGRAVVSVLV